MTVLQHHRHRTVTAAGAAAQVPQKVCVTRSDGAGGAM